MVHLEEVVGVLAVLHLASVVGNRVAKVIHHGLGISLDQLAVISILHGSVGLEESDKPCSHRGYASKGHMSTWFLESSLAVSRVTPPHAFRTSDKMPAPTSAVCFKTHPNEEDDLIQRPSWFPHVCCDPSQFVQFVLLSEV